MSGVGKTETALQLFKELSDAPVEAEYIEGRFNCDSLNSLIGDLRSFGDDYGFQLESLANQDQGVEKVRLVEVFNELFAVLNDTNGPGFGNKSKFFTFDDAEQSTNIVLHLNNLIGKSIAAGQRGQEVHKKWKLIVTTQDDDQNVWLRGCDHVCEENFHTIEHFTLEETRQYLSIIPYLREEQTELDRIHKALGGLPLALQAARTYLMEDRVRI